MKRLAILITLCLGCSQHRVPRKLVILGGDGHVHAFSNVSYMNEDNVLCIYESNHQVAAYTNWQILESPVEAEKPQ